MEQTRTVLSEFILIEFPLQNHLTELYVMLRSNISNFYCATGRVGYNIVYSYYKCFQCGRGSIRVDNKQKYHENTLQSNEVNHKCLV